MEQSGTLDKGQKHGSIVEDIMYGQKEKPTDNQPSPNSAEVTPTDTSKTKGWTHDLNQQVKPRIT